MLLTANKPVTLQGKLANCFRSWTNRGEQNPTQNLYPKSKDRSRKFDADNERLFWQERYVEIQPALKTALFLGAMGFLAFLSVDLHHQKLPIEEVIARLLMFLVLMFLFIYQHFHPRPQSQIKPIAKISASISVIGLVGFLLWSKSPLNYPYTWLGLLPIYFFTYGQMFMPIIDTLIFGLISSIIMLLSARWVGVNVLELMPSLIVLAMINVFGCFTRCQLESNARNLFQERRKAETSADDKAQFLRQLSHNLRQPLQAICCYASIIDVMLTDKPHDPLYPFTSRLGTAIDELNKAFNHILAIANLETGKQTPLISVVEVNSLLVTLENQFQPQAAKKGLIFKIRLRLQAPYYIYSDANILLQILSNLMDNAIKYTNHGWIIVEAVKTGDSNQLKIHIRDTGIGITDKHKEHIFKEFFRGHRRREDPHVQGLGIGLAYVAKAMEHLPGHSLQFYSRLHRGSDFQIRVPIAHESKLEKPIKVQGAINLAGVFVFVVDDDLEVLNALCDQLTSWGCLVQQARSIAETLAALDEIQRPPDLLITDFYLEDNETARDIIAAIVNDCGPVATLILSARGIPLEEKEKWPENTYLLRKPTSANVLQEAMALAIGKLDNEQSE